MNLYQFTMKYLIILTICVYLCLGDSIPSHHQKWPSKRTSNQVINPDGSYAFSITDPGKEWRAEVGFHRRGDDALTVQGFFIIRQGDGLWQIQIYEAGRQGTKILLSETTPHFPVVPPNLVPLIIKLNHLIPKGPTRYYPFFE